MKPLALVWLVGCGHGFFDPQPPDARAEIDAASPSIVYKQSTLATSLSGQTSAQTATLPFPVSAGDLVVVAIGWSSATGAAISTVFDSGGNTYGVASGPTLGFAGIANEIFVAPAAGGGQITVQVALTQPVILRMTVVAYANIDGQHPVDSAQATVGNGSTPVAAGPVATSSAHDLLFVAGYSDNFFNDMLPGFQTRASGPDSITEDLEVESVGTYAPMTGAGTAGDWVMQLVALRGL